MENDIKPTRWFGGYELILHHPEYPYFIPSVAMKVARDLLKQNYTHVKRIKVNNNTYLIYRSKYPTAKRRKHLPDRENRKTRTEMYLTIARKAGYSM